MKRSFYANLAFLFFVNLLIKPFWILGIDRTVQNRLGAEEYGLYFALFNFSMLFQVFLDFGINNLNNRLVAQDKHFIAASMPAVASLKLLLAAGYCIVTLLAATVLDYTFRQIFLLALLTANQVIASFLLYLRSNLSGMHLFRIDSILSVTDRLLMILICGFLLWGPYCENFSINWFIYAQTASLGLTLLMALVLVAHKASPAQSTGKRLKVGQLLRMAYPYALLGLMMTIYYRIDGIMLERMLPEGAFEAGVYAASFRLLDAANNMVGVLFASLLLPMFARLIREGGDVHELGGAAARLIITLAALITTSAIFYRNEIIGLLYPQAPAEWASVLAMLFLSFPGICLVYVYGTLLTANGSISALNRIALAGMALNILLNYFLIPPQKALGASLATVTTQTLVAGAHLYVTARVFPFPLRGNTTFPFFGYLIAVVILIGLARQLPLFWGYSLLISLLASVLLGNRMGIISLNWLSQPPIRKMNPPE
ncbi:MAG: peptide-binding protein [Chitinophagales bacterium]|nr:MAG: peptide-binding protein [Chitinophagales bacterium]